MSGRERRGEFLGAPPSRRLVGLRAGETPALPNGSNNSGPQPITLITAIPRVRLRGGRGKCPKSAGEPRSASTGGLADVAATPQADVGKGV